jgi:hypothetical protein
VSASLSPEQQARDAAVPWRTFLGVGVFIAVIAVVYWFSSYDYAGSIMLLLASGLSFFSATYLWRQARSSRSPAAATSTGEIEKQYLPHASLWPFGIGLGAFLTFNGLVVGPGYAIPGAIVIGGSIAGLVMQSRRRD